MTHFPTLPHCLSRLLRSFVRVFGDVDLASDSTVCAVGIEGTRPPLGSDP